MKPKIIQGLLFSLLATLAVYAIIKSDILQKISFSYIFSLRFLVGEVTDESINAMCSKSSLNLVDFYKTTPPNYDYKVPSGSETLNKLAEDLMKGNTNFDISLVKDYFFENGRTIFVLVLFIFLIIFWIPFCSCICCKLCLCVPEVMFKYIKFIFIGCLVVCLVICIVCFIGFAQNNSLFSGIYGFGCSLLKITRHLILGDEYTLQKPYWSGLKPILDKLDQTKHNISELFDKTIDLNQNFSNLNNIFNNLRDDLFSEFSTRNETKLFNPEPDKEQFIPINYIKAYGPPDNFSTTLGLINSNLEIFRPYTLGAIGDILSIVSLSKENTNQIVELLDDGINAIRTNINGVDEKIGNALTNVNEVIDNINNISSKVMNSIFGVNLGLVILIIISLVLIYFYKFGHCFLCFGWTLLYIFMLCSVVIGAIFLVLGLFLQNLSYGISNIVKDVRKLDKDNKVFEVIDVCFNGNGLLYQTLIPEDLNVSAVEKIYNVEKSIIENINELKKYEITSTKIVKEKYNDFNKYPKKYIDELVQSLDNVGKYIDGSLDETKVSEDSEFYDEWELNKEDCNEEYEYLSPSSNMRRLVSVNRHCLVITEWTQDQIIERYNDIKSNDDSNIKEEILKYYDSITQFADSKDSFISEIMEENNLFNTTLYAIKDNAITMMSTLLNIVRPFRESFRDIVGDGNIFEILNCSFLRRDFNKFMEVLYEEFGSTFRKVSDLFFTICVFQIAMTLLILIIISSKKKEDSQDGKKDELYVGLKDVGQLENN